MLLVLGWEGFSAGELPPLPGSAVFGCRPKKGLLLTEAEEGAMAGLRVSLGLLLPPGCWVLENRFLLEAEAASRLLRGLMPEVILGTPTSASGAEVLCLSASEEEEEDGSRFKFSLREGGECGEKGEGSLCPPLGCSGGSWDGAGWKGSC